MLDLWNSLRHSLVNLVVYEVHTPHYQLFVSQPGGIRGTYTTLSKYSLVNLVVYEVRTPHYQKLLFRSTLFWYTQSLTFFVDQKRSEVVPQLSYLLEHPVPGFLKCHVYWDTLSLYFKLSSLLGHAVSLYFSTVFSSLKM